MKKIKYIYVVSLKDKKDNDLYLSPTGKITSDFIRWDYVDMKDTRYFKIVPEIMTTKEVE